MQRGTQIKPVGRPVCRSDLPRLESRIGYRAGQIDFTRLFACGAGVHVDFHANRHFDNLRSFPGHSKSPIVDASFARLESKASSDATQVFHSKM